MEKNKEAARRFVFGIGESKLPDELNTSRDDIMYPLVKNQRAAQRLGNRR